MNMKSKIKITGSKKKGWMIKCYLVDDSVYGGVYRDIWPLTHEELLLLKKAIESKKGVEVSGALTDTKKKSIAVPSGTGIFATPITSTQARLEVIAEIEKWVVTNNQWIYPREKQYVSSADLLDYLQELKVRKDK